MNFLWWLLGVVFALVFGPFTGAPPHGQGNTVSPAPVYTCDSLTAIKIDRTDFKFTTAATAANGAEIVNYTYDFGDTHKQSVSSTSVNHTYAEPGIYTVTVTVNGETKVVSGPHCQTTVKVEEMPVAPVYSCYSLTATKITDGRYRFTTDATVMNGAVIVGYTYDFGDDSLPRLVEGDRTIDHTYLTPGTYVAIVIVNVKVAGTTKTVTGSSCRVIVEVDTP